MLSLSSILPAPRPPHTARRPAWGLPPPCGPVALTITGRICWPNSAEGLRFDAPLLRGLPQHTITTTTDWPGLTRPQQFRGADLMGVLRAAGWRGDRVTLHGKDGYTADVRLAELRGSGALIATEIGGMPMNCTRHGPLWLVFDYDAAPDRIARWRLKALSVWALIRIEVH